MYTTDFAYDGPIFLVPFSPSYPSSPVFEVVLFCLFQVVPTALMCAISKMGVVEAQNALRNSPVIRNAIVSCLRQKQGDE